jgi:glycosyltransferase involved in cell wall biosynthesis
MPKVSVIIQTYNRKEFLPEALESAFSQTFKDYEVVVIDDGSQDGTDKFMAEYLKNCQHDIRYIFQKNQGIPLARNRGINECKGQYIAFLDSDDLFMPEKLAKCVAFLDQNPDYGMVYTDLFLVDEKGNILESWFQSKKEFSQGNIYRNLLKECFIIPTSSVIRTEVFKKIGYFDPEIYFCNDYDLWIRISRHFKIGLIKEPLVKWRQHNQNASKNFKATAQDNIKIFSKQLNIKDQDSFSRMLLRKKLSINHFDLGIWNLADERIALARHDFMKSYYYSPNRKSLIRFIICCFPSKAVASLRLFRNKRRVKNEPREH